MLDRNFIRFESPQINLSRSTFARMWITSGAVFCAILQSSISDNGRSLFIALSAVTTAVICEILCNLKSGIHTITDGSAVASALIFSLLLPNTIHPIFAAAGSAFAILIIKHSFGGLGTNWLNPALGALIFIRLSWPHYYFDALSNFGNISADTSYLSSAGSFTHSVDLFITSFINRTFLKPLGASLPTGYIEIFNLQSAGIIADRAVFALIIGSIVITAFQVNRFWQSALYISAYLFIVHLAGVTYHIGATDGDMLFALLRGGTLPAAFFLLIDISAGAKTKYGAACTAILCALLTWFFRYMKNEPYGALFAVLCVNALTSLIRHIEARSFYQQRNAS